MFKRKSNVDFKFLDEETSYLEDLQVILKCPKILFIKALVRSISAIYNIVTLPAITIKQ
jgi:lycopene beta-cyclase